MYQNTISIWLRLVVNQAYVSASAEDCTDRWVKVHEVWKVATSLLFRRNCAVHQVLKFDTWCLQLTFSSSYVRDVTHRHLDTFSIGLVVAAQQDV